MHTPDICPIDPHKNNFLQLENCSKSSPFQFLKKRGGVKMTYVVFCITKKCYQRHTKMKIMLTYLIKAATICANEIF